MGIMYGNPVPFFIIVEIFMMRRRRKRSLVVSYESLGLEAAISDQERLPWNSRSCY